MSSPYENIPYADDKDVTLQRSSSSSGFSGRDLGVWIKDTVNGSGIFNSRGQSNGQHGSSEGTQSMNGQDNVSEIVSGAPQLAADPAYSSGDEMDEKTGLSLEDAYMDMESSSFEPEQPAEAAADFEALLEQGNFDLLNEFSQTNTNCLGYTSDASVSSHVTPPQTQGSVACMDQGMDPQGMSPLGMSSQGMSAQDTPPKDTSAQGMDPQGTSAQGMSPKDTSQGMSPLDMSTQDTSAQNMVPQGMSTLGMAPHSMALQGMSTQGMSMQGSAMQRYYPNPNGTQWNPAYVAQGGPFYGHPSHDVSRGIHDGTSVYNSSESESPTGGARQQEHTSGILASSGGEHATGALTGSRVGSSLDFGNPNPIILPGNNIELIRNPSSDSGYSPSAKVCDLLSSLDKKTPGFVPSMSDVYNAGSNGVDTSTIFSDAQSSQKFIEKHDYHDDTIPRTLDQQKAIVKVLFKAMKNVDHAQDNENMITPFRKGKYSNARIEKVCWSIMQTCIYRHSHGSLLANYGMKSKQSAGIDTYAERISKIIELLTLRKTICKHLLDPFFIFHVVDDPVHARKRVESNKTLNQRKGTYMVLGKKAAEDEESAKNSPMPKSENVITPPTVERLQNGKASSSNPERTMTPQEAIEAQNKDTTNSSVTAGHSAHVGSGTNRKPSGLSQAETVSPSPAPKTHGACLDHAQKLIGSGPSCPQDKPFGNGTPGHPRNSSFEFGVTPSSEDGQTVVFNGNNNDDDGNNNKNKTKSNNHGSIGNSPPSSTASPIIGRKRGAPELDEAAVPKKRHLSSGSGASPSSENDQVAVLNNDNNQISNGQSQSLSTVSPSRKRGASEWDEAAVAKKRRS